MESRFDRRELLFQPRGIPPPRHLALPGPAASGGHDRGVCHPAYHHRRSHRPQPGGAGALIQASLVMSAVCTFLQLYPIGGRFGSGLPVILGVSFAYVPSMQAIAASGGGWRPLPAP